MAAFKSVVVVDRLPKTRLGKMLRGTIVHIADDTPWMMPATVDDPVIFDEITDALLRFPSLVATWGAWEIGILRRPTASSGQR